jgi:hypothetical protein
MEMDCNAHQIFPVSKILICARPMLVVFSQLQVIMNVSVMKGLQEMEMCVKVSPHYRAFDLTSCTINNQ